LQEKVKGGKRVSEYDKGMWLSQGVWGHPAMVYDRSFETESLKPFFHRFRKCHSFFFQVGVNGPPEFKGNRVGGGVF